VDACDDPTRTRASAIRKIQPEPSEDPNPSAVVDACDDAIIGKTLDGTIVSWNKGAEKVYGYQAAEILGQPISVLIPPGHPNELPEIMVRLRRGHAFLVDVESDIVNNVHWVLPIEVSEPARQIRSRHCTLQENPSSSAPLYIQTDELLPFRSGWTVPTTGVSVNEVAGAVFDGFSACPRWAT
jgi:PAS domain S-box-containing protein